MSGAGCATVTDHKDVLGLEPNALTILLHCFICADSSATLSEPAIPAATVTFCTAALHPFVRDCYITVLTTITFLCLAPIKLCMTKFICNRN